MNHSNESTPLCFSINSPPFNYTHTIASAYFSSVFSALGLTFNLIAFVVLLKSFLRTQSRSRSSFLIFLCGLVFTDFMGLLVTGSIVVSFHFTQFNWRLLDPHCHFCNFMGMSMVFYGLCPLLLGATMAMERFVGINRPFARSTSMMTKSRAVSIVLLVWAGAGCISLLPLVGVGSYHMQIPGSWCFVKISSEASDMAFCLLFSLVGLLSIAVSFLLNTISVVTLVKVCCSQDARQRRRDYEVEMMVQLIWIMMIASICWCPLLLPGGEWGTIGEEGEQEGEYQESLQSGGGPTGAPAEQKPHQTSPRQVTTQTHCATVGCIYTSSLIQIFCPIIGKRISNGLPV
uniref:Thromboxane A2 receptor n=1 Tax=Oncorhynchus kisutch TaxID=8019 RepID=A0A8C7G4Q1_ONCKI